MKKKWTAEERAAFAAKMAQYRKKGKKRQGKPSERRRAFAHAKTVVRKVSRKIRRKRKNPMQPGVVLFIQKGKGPKMHFNGEKFTNNGKPKKFATIQAAENAAITMRKRYPVLRDYSFRVSFPGKV